MNNGTAPFLHSINKFRFLLGFEQQIEERGSHGLLRRGLLSSFRAAAVSGGPSSASRQLPSLRVWDRAETREETWNGEDGFKRFLGATRVFWNKRKSTHFPFCPHPFIPITSMPPHQFIQNALHLFYFTLLFSRDNYVILYLEIISSLNSFKSYPYKSFKYSLFRELHEKKFRVITFFSP